MYAPPYGFGPTPSHASPFNPNVGMPPQPGPHSTPHQQPLQQQQQQQHQQQHQHPQQQHQQQQQQQQQQRAQQPQHMMMYNPQAFGASSYDPRNAGAVPMMQQNGGLAHLPGGVAQYQTPYTTSPYGASVPSLATSLPPNFLPSTSAANAPSRAFPMNAPNLNMNPQAMNQRIQPPTPNRASYGNLQHSTPPNASTASSQFATPQNQTTNQQLQQQIQSTAGAGVTTPQTPNFSHPGQTGLGVGQVATPLSPGSEAREKERVTLLLEINRELLMTVIDWQNAQQAEKEESASIANTTTSTDQDKAEKDKGEKNKLSTGREYVECMRRLQSNLAYLAAIADRSHKPSNQIPAHPTIMTAPVLNLKPNPSPDVGNAPKPESPSNSETKKVDGEEQKQNKEESKGLTGQSKEERMETLKDQYRRLQALFPGVDPKKDHTIQRVNEASRQQMQAKAQAHAQAQAQAQTQAAAGTQVGQGQMGQKTPQTPGVATEQQEGQAQNP